MFYVCSTYVLRMFYVCSMYVLLILYAGPDTDTGKTAMDEQEMSKGYARDRQGTKEIQEGCKRGMW